MTDLGHKFSKQLKKTRTEKGKSQQWAADECGLSRATINRWESEVGAGDATLAKVEMLAQALKISTSEMLDLHPPQARVEIPAEEWNRIRAALRPPEDSLDLSTLSPVRREFIQIIASTPVDDPKLTEALAGFRLLLKGPPAKTQKSEKTG